MTPPQKSKRTHCKQLSCGEQFQRPAGEHFDRAARFCNRAAVLTQYLANGAYRFSMAFGRATFADFYGRTAEHERILEERKRWLAEDKEKYLAALPESAGLLQETVELGIENGTLGTLRESAETTEVLARKLGESWEPDYLLLKFEGERARLVCGCVCFPSSWALEEKIGRPIEEIHDVVPALNASIGRQIATFLSRIKPGVSWTRSNWGLSRSPERNQHPVRRTPRLDATVTLNEVFFRVEEQSLVALPKCGGILFGIRLKIFPLGEYSRTEAGLKLAGALETMPDEMARYKGLDVARSRIVRLLKG